MTTPGRIRLREAAQMMGLSRQTLRRMAREGAITYWEVGRGRYMEFDPADVGALFLSFKRDRRGPPVY